MLSILCHMNHSTFNYIIDGEKLKQPRKICEKSYLSCESTMWISKKAIQFHNERNIINHSKKEKYNIKCLIVGKF